MLTLVDGHRILIMHANSAIVFAAKRVQYSRVSHKASVKRTQYTHTHREQQEKCWRVACARVSPARRRCELVRRPTSARATHQHIHI